MAMSGSRTYIDSSRSSRRRGHREDSMETDDTMFGYSHESNRPGTPEQAVPGMPSGYSAIGLNKTREFLQILQRVIDLKPEVEREMDTVEKPNVALQAQVQELERKNKELEEIVQQQQIQLQCTGTGPEKDKNVENSKQNYGDVLGQLKAYEEQSSKLQSDIRRLQNTSKQAEQKWNESESRYIHAQTVLQELQEQSNKEKYQLHELQKEYSIVNSEKQTAEEKLKNFQSRAEEKIKQDMHDIEQLQQALDVKNAAVAKKTEELEAVRKELDETKSRLSKIMGSRMKDGNPYIADLSDKNRPTKLADAYSELYDNEWTDAFDDLQKVLYTRDDEDVVKALYDILMDVSQFFKNEAEHQINLLKECLLLDKMTDQALAGNLLQQQMDIRRSNAGLGVKEACERYDKYLLHSNSTISYKARQVPDFVNKCVEVCWVMELQNPPLVFKTEIKSMPSLSKDEYKVYTKMGQYIDFVVWPPLLLHKDGPILAKGVAQGWPSLSESTKHIKLKESRASPRTHKEAWVDQGQSVSYQSTTPSTICTQSPLTSTMEYSTCSSGLTYAQTIVTSSARYQTSHLSNFRSERDSYV